MFDISTEKRWLREFGAYIASRKEDIQSSNWELSKFLKRVPRKHWLPWFLRQCTEALLRRCRASACLRRVSASEEWPCNFLLCPDDLTSLPNHDFSLFIAVYFTEERDTFLQTYRRSQGPIITSLGIAAVTDATLSFISTLNGEVVSGYFHSFAFDNINVRSKYALDVNGATYYGFDGFASQFVIAQPSFYFKTSLNGLEGFSGGKARVKYLTVERASAQDEITIVRELRKIEIFVVNESNKHGRPVIVAIAGDQPIFKLLFRLCYNSYLDKSNLCKWMVSFPGGFHINKQGIIPTTKHFM